MSLFAVSVVSENLLWFMLYTIESIVCNFNCSCERTINGNVKKANAENASCRSF